jgi:hypothetical protein
MVPAFPVLSRVVQEIVGESREERSVENARSQTPKVPPDSTTNCSPETEVRARVAAPGRVSNGKARHELKQRNIHPRLVFHLLIIPAVSL